MSTAIAFKEEEGRTISNRPTLGQRGDNSELSSTGDRNLDILRQFLYFTSHDLNNPLRHIKMLAEEIKEDKGVLS